MHSKPALRTLSNIRVSINGFEDIDSVAYNDVVAMAMQCAAIVKKIIVGYCHGIRRS